MYKTRYQPVWKSFFVWLFGDLSFLVFAGGLTWFFYQPGRGYILLFDGAMITIFLYFFCHTAYVHLTTLYVDDYVISVRLLSHIFGYIHHFLYYFNFNHN